MSGLNFEFSSHPKSTKNPLFILSVRERSFYLLPDFSLFSCDVCVLFLNMDFPAFPFQFHLINYSVNIFLLKMLPLPVITWGFKTVPAYTNNVEIYPCGIEISTQGPLLILPLGPLRRCCDFAFPWFNAIIFDNESS